MVTRIRKTTLGLTLEPCAYLTGKIHILPYILPFIYKINLFKYKILKKLDMYPVDGLPHREELTQGTVKHSYVSTNLWWGTLQEQKELQNAGWTCWWCYSDSVVGVLWDKANEQECDVLIQSFLVWLSTRIPGVGERKYRC